MQIKDTIKKHASNCNSLVSLYPGYEYFSTSEGQGVIAYAKTKRALICPTEPFSSSEHLKPALSEFAKNAEKNGKAAMLLAVNEALAEHAEQIGFKKVFIGMEPIFDFKTYKPDIERIYTAKQLKAKGARVLEFRPQDLSVEKKLELDLIVKEWLSTRTLPPFTFLNHTEPFLLSEEKRYFLLEHNKKTLAFISALSIPAKNSWYLMDILKRKGTPAGATELLVLETMKTLKDSGANEITLGVSPLAQLDPTIKRKQPILYWLMQFCFEHLDFIYHFKSLWAFKRKFGPTRIEPRYLVTTSNLSGFFEVSSVHEAFSRHSFFETFFWVLRKIPQPRSVLYFFRSGFKEEYVVRSVPQTLIVSLYRCKITLLLALLNVFMWEKFYIFFLSIFVCGLLEFFFGTLFVALCYIMPALFASVTEVVNVDPTFFIVPNWPKWGILGCFGALMYFLKVEHRIFLSSIVLAAFLRISNTKHLSASATAACIGFLIAALYFKLPKFQGSKLSTRPSILY